MTGVAFDALAEKKNQLIRKALDGSVFVAPFSADPITSITGTDKLLKALPTGYDDVGLLSDDGIEIGRSVDTSDVKSFGKLEPTRSDIKSDTSTVKIACQETKLTTIGLYSGADLTAITPDATSGEVWIPKPSRPSVKLYRVLSIAVDLTDDGEIYICRFFPKAKVTDYDGQSFKEEDEAILYSVTMTGYTDSVLGYSEAWAFGGEGWHAILTDMGF